MKYLSAIQKQINKLDKKEVFLWGFYISFIIVMALAMIIDYQIDNLSDAYIELFFILATLGSFYFWRKSLNNTHAVYSIVLLATLTTYTYIFSNQYTVSIYHIIVPLGYFFLFPLRVSLLLTAAHDTVVVLLYIANYYLHPEYLVYHHPAIVTASALGSLMIIFFGIVYHLSIENSYQRLSHSDRQKEMLLREVHHRVKNNLNIISSMIGLQIIKEPQPRIQDILDKNRHRIRSIALVHEILYKHDDFEKIDIREYLIKLADTLLGMYDKEVRVTIAGNQFELPIEQVMRIGIIANELITNSIKYALDTDNPYITIELTQDQNFWTFTYSDSHTTPIDLTQAQNTQSLGMGFVEMMVEQLDAQMTIDSQAGLVYTIQIPKQTA